MAIQGSSGYKKKWQHWHREQDQVVRSFTVKIWVARVASKKHYLVFTSVLSLDT